MRPIKFRAWDGSKMYLPEQSDNDDFMLDCEGSVVHTREVGYERHMQIFRRTGWVLMQYTGLKDKLGNDIYEDDIYITHGEMRDYYVVDFDHGAFIGKRIINGGGMPLGWDNDIKEANMDWMEVIGNIYEHPHLIPQQQKQ